MRTVTELASVARKGCWLQMAEGGRGCHSPRCSSYGTGPYLRRWRAPEDPTYTYFMNMDLLGCDEAGSEQQRTLIRMRVLLWLRWRLTFGSQKHCPYLQKRQWANPYACQPLPLLVLQPQTKTLETPENNQISACRRTCPQNSQTHQCLGFWATLKVYFEYLALTVVIWQLRW